MSRLRAKCPSCRTYTAVALGPDYECHACGRDFTAGLVRVPRAWGAGGEAMEEAAMLHLDYPEAAVVAEDSLERQTRAVADALPERPVVLGGCCCAHIGAVEVLAERHGRIALLWIDAHGDLNTPATSPSGNAWGMPLRMLLGAGTVSGDDVALVGARNLDPAERELIDAGGVRSGETAVEAALEGTSGVYVAFDFDALEPGEASMFMPESGGLTLDEAEALLAGVAARATLLGAGFAGLTADPRNVAVLARLSAAVGL